MGRAYLWIASGWIDRAFMKSCFTTAFSSFEELTIIVIYRTGLSAIGVNIWSVRHATNRSHRFGLRINGEPTSCPEFDPFASFSDPEAVGGYLQRYPWSLASHRPSDSICG
jgi:hypothetical protein